MLYILQTSPIFNTPISKAAIGQLKQSKLYFTKILLASGYSKTFNIFSMLIFEGDGLKNILPEIPFALLPSFLF